MWVWMKIWKSVKLAYTYPKFYAKAKVETNNQPTKMNNFSKCWVKKWQHQMQVWMQMWKSKKLSRKYPRLDAQAEVGMDNQHVDTLQIYILSCTIPCTLAKEFTH
jgi:hypothetical protein